MPHLLKVLWSFRTVLIPSRDWLFKPVSPEGAFPLSTINRCIQSFAAQPCPLQRSLLRTVQSIYNFFFSKVSLMVFQIILQFCIGPQIMVILSHMWSMKCRLDMLPYIMLNLVVWVLYIKKISVFAFNFYNFSEVKFFICYPWSIHTLLPLTKHWQCFSHSQEMALVQVIV